MSTSDQGPCAKCGEHKPLPYRRDDLGGYVCLTCVEQYLDATLARAQAAEQERERLDKLVCAAERAAGLDGPIDVVIATLRARLDAAIRSQEDFALAALKNYGADVECGACMSVAFTGVTTTTHSCAPKAPRPIGAPMTSGILRGNIKAGDEVRAGRHWYTVHGRGIFGWLQVREIPERPESRSQINQGDVEEIR